MEFGGRENNFPQRRRRKRRKGGGFKSKGSSKGVEAERGDRLLISPPFSSFLCNTVHLDLNPLFTPNSRILKTLKGAHPTHLFFTSQPMYSKCYRHTGMHPPSPSLHRSTLSVFKGRSAHTFEGEGLHVCEGKVTSSMAKGPIQRLAGTSQRVHSTS